MLSLNIDLWYLFCFRHNLYSIRIHPDCHWTLLFFDVIRFWLMFAHEIFQICIKSFYEGRKVHREPYQILWKILLLQQLKLFQWKKSEIRCNKKYRTLNPFSRLLYETKEVKKIYKILIKHAVTLDSPCDLLWVTFIFKRYIRS